MYDRRYGRRTLTFDFGEGLVQDNLLLVDRETDSIWSQLHGRAISGPLRDRPMRVVPTIQTTWGHWKRLHPETLVLQVPGSVGTSFAYSPERGPVGLGLTIGNEAFFAPLHVLKERVASTSPRSLGVTVGGKPIRIFCEPSAPSAWARSESGELLPGVLAYRSGWFSFHPESNELVGAAPEGEAHTPRRK